MTEQFHSEFKTDLDIERLPSGKFATNDLVMACAVLAYNILRWIGLEGLTGPDAPIRHEAKRRRLRTVMQELMYVAARVIESGRQLALKFSVACPASRASPPSTPSSRQTDIASVETARRVAKPREVRSLRVFRLRRYIRAARPRSAASARWGAEALIQVTLHFKSGLFISARNE